MERTISVPELIMWTATRVALGIGIGMLVSRRMSRQTRKSTGIALTSVGGLITIPLAISMFGKKNVSRELRSIA